MDLERGELQYWLDGKHLGILQHDALKLKGERCGIRHPACRATFVCDSIPPPLKSRSIESSCWLGVRIPLATGREWYVMVTFRFGSVAAVATFQPELLGGPP